MSNPYADLTEYELTHLPAHLSDAEVWNELEALLTDLDFLEAKTEAGMVFALAADLAASVKAIPSDRPQATALTILSETFLLSTHVLVRDKHLLRNQLNARLPLQLPPLLAACREQLQGASAPWMKFTSRTLSRSGGVRQQTLEFGNYVDCCLTASGTRLIVAQEGVLKVLDVATGREIRVLKGNLGALLKVASTEDGRLAVSGNSDGTLAVWALDRGERLFTLPGHSHAVSALAISGRGTRLVSGASDGSLRVWDLERVQELWSVQGHEKPVGAICVTDRGDRAVSAAGEGTVKVWDLEAHAELFAWTDYRGVQGLALDPEENRVACTANEYLMVRDIRSGKEITDSKIKRWGQGSVCVVEWLPGGKQVVTGDSGGTVEIWDASPGGHWKFSLVKSLGSHSRAVRTLAVTANGECVISVATDGSLVRWNARRSDSRPNEHGDAVLAVTVTPDGTTAVSFGGASICVWDVEQGRVVREHSHGQYLRTVDIDITADGTRACTVDQESRITMWNLEDGKKVLAISPRQQIHSLAITPDGSRVVYGGAREDSVHVHDLQQNTHLHALPGHTGGVWDLAISSDGRRVVSCSRDGVQCVWDLESGRLLRTWNVEGHPEAVCGNARYVLKYNNNRLAVRDITTRDIVGDCEFDGPIRCAAISADGSTVVAGGIDGMVHLLRLCLPHQVGSGGRIPPELQPYDFVDSEHFQGLLPPPERPGLPRQIQFWKDFLESSGLEPARRIGLLHGQCGSGKTSLLKAGVLPRLSGSTRVIYVLATPHETERDLLSELQKQFSDLPVGHSLASALDWIADFLGRNPAWKLVIVVDQFERWLYEQAAGARSRLWDVVANLDVERMRCLIAMHSDAVPLLREFGTRIPLTWSTNHNVMSMDGFDDFHARHALARLGHSMGKLPSESRLTGNQEAFLSDAIDGLADGNHPVLPIRLALFAEARGNRDWTDTTSDESTDVVERFLAGRFGSDSPWHRHRRATARILHALLPAEGIDLRNHMRADSDLRQITGYDQEGFSSLIRLLSQNLRLITPTMPISPSTTEKERAVRYYRISNDFLVPSIRNWVKKVLPVSLLLKRLLKIPLALSGWTHPNKPAEPSHASDLKPTLDMETILRGNKHQGCWMVFRHGTFVPIWYFEGRTYVDNWRLANELLDQFDVTSFRCHYVWESAAGGWLVVSDSVAVFVFVRDEDVVRRSTNSQKLPLWHRWIGSRASQPIADYVQLTGSLTNHEYRAKAMIAEIAVENLKQDLLFRRVDYYRTSPLAGGCARVLDPVTALGNDG